jgi:hypothetical protein
MPLCGYTDGQIGRPTLFPHARQGNQGSLGELCSAEKRTLPTGA